ncbi:MAG: DUF3365 domain-containing protein [Magnetococcus sp. WYHC-3]
MSRNTTLSVLLSAAMLLGASGTTQAAEEGEVAALVAESRGMVQTFFGKLKGELEAAMKNGGPAAAIKTCNEKAIPLTDELGAQSGWTLGRTSLKLRNPDNAPDAWERSVLESFETRKAAGEDVTKLEQHVIVEEGGQRLWRYMKAIPTAAQPCLLCHSAALLPAVASQIKELYPEDQAVGYAAGDIRGAFTFQKVIK